ncbi:MAG: 8-oxo-dGTP diphosphatase [Candidatus Sungbacteria bacterium]|nr:8-oxo-dGTP diphosphatase [Candidatus Sungbacteria bacterium]
MKKVLTLCLITQEGKILLGMKKRGFGVGRWNGFGGKVLPGETIEAAVVRECQEEAGISPLGMSFRAKLLFHFEGSAEDLEVHVFLAEAFEGEVRESQEMRPAWFACDAIPYGAMWPDDSYWLPQVLAGKKLVGTFWFKDTKTLLRHRLREV